MLQQVIKKTRNVNKTGTKRTIVFILVISFFLLSVENKLVAQSVSIQSHDAKVGVDETNHSFINVPPGSLLVLSTTSQYGSNLDPLVSSVPSLVWTNRVDAEVNQTATGGAEIYTAIFAAGGNISVKSAWGNNGGHYQSSVCYVVVNQEEVLDGTFGLEISASQPAVNLTTSRSNSLIFCVTSDWEAIGGTITYRGTATQTLMEREPADASFYHYYYSAANAQAYTVGLTSPDMAGGATTAALEIRSKEDAIPPSAFTLSTSSIGYNIIDITWTAATDNVGVTGYDVYVGGVLHGSTSSTSYSATGLAQLTQYSIYIKAKDAAGNSTNSNTITPTTNGTVWSLTGNGGTNPSTNFIGTTDDQGLAVRTNNVGRMFISSDGNVGIGTTEVSGGDFKLYVQTGIRTHRVKVDQANWPDYVFDKKYRLPSLREIEAFILRNKHLPGIPPASEIENEGLDLGDQQARLLKTIEELTLHMIQLNKQVERLTSENEILKSKIESLGNE